MKKLTIQEKKDTAYSVRPNHLEHKEVDMTKRTVDLIANTYWWFDTDADVLVPGCCAKSITDRGPQSKMPGKIKHANHHELKEAYAKPVLIEETTMKGLEVLHANSFFPETQLAEDKLIEYQHEMIDQHSIGFNYLQIEFIEKEAEGWDDVMAKLINPEDAEAAGFMYLVKEVALYEYSNVAFGANRLTPSMGAKSNNPNIKYNNLITKLKALHEGLRSGGDKYLMLIEEKQINQMIYELINPEPSLKDTQLEPSGGDTLDIASLVKNY